MWIDTHAHLDAPEFNTFHLKIAEIIARAATKNVAIVVIPAVEKNNFSAVRSLAHEHSQAYALGIHPLYIPAAQKEDLQHLDEMLNKHRDDPRLVAVGEIGLDFFLPELCVPQIKAKQIEFYQAQLKLADKYELPVILHVRKSADLLLQGLRKIKVAGGIAHAFNGSIQQAMQFVEQGFALGFGGAMTYESALHLRALAQDLPLESIVMETDSPDIPPQWLYVNAEQRRSGLPQGINTPLELPRIGQVIAQLRGVSIEDWQNQSTANAIRALPKLKTLIAP